MQRHSDPGHQLAGLLGDESVDDPLPAAAGVNLQRSLNLFVIVSLD